MGDQIFTSRTLNDTLNPKWNFNCQFHIRDVYQDVLCITIFEKDLFSPDGQLHAVRPSVVGSSASTFFYLGRDKILIFSCWYPANKYRFFSMCYFGITFFLIRKSMLKYFESSVFCFLTVPLSAIRGPLSVWHCSSLSKELKVFFPFSVTEILWFPHIMSFCLRISVSSCCCYLGQNVLTVLCCEVVCDSLNSCQMETKN